MTRHTKQTIIKVPATLAVMAPILALATASLWTGSVNEVVVDVEVAVATPASLYFIVLVDVKVVNIPALVVVIVLVTFVVASASKKSASDTSNGVLVFEQDSCNKSHTCVRIDSPWFAMHVAVLMMKSPVLAHRHLFSSNTVSPPQPAIPAASSRHV